MSNHETTAKNLKQGDLFWLHAKRFRATAVVKFNNGRICVTTPTASLLLGSDTPVTIHSNYSK